MCNRSAKRKRAVEENKEKENDTKKKIGSTEEKYEDAERIESRWELMPLGSNPGIKLELRTGKTILGRTKKCELRDIKLSREHAEIQVSKDNKTVTLKPLYRKKNGVVRVNNKAQNGQSSQIYAGDIISLWFTEYSYRLEVISVINIQQEYKVQSRHLPFSSFTTSNLGLSLHQHQHPGVAFHHHHAHPENFPYHKKDQNKEKIRKKESGLSYLAQSAAAILLFCSS
uniref:FHA domain-containing protein n=1 Tax=Aureoumbra lagunensis TaxID=44058 RepID=A0A7S3NHA7_9STRA